MMLINTTSHKKHPIHKNQSVIKKGSLHPNNDHKTFKQSYVKEIKKWKKIFVLKKTRLINPELKS